VKSLDAITTSKPNFYYIVYDIFKHKNLLHAKNQNEDNYGGFQNLRKLLWGERRERKEHPGHGRTKSYAKLRIFKFFQNAAPFT